MSFTDFGVLTKAAMTARLAQYMSVWFIPDYKLDTLDGARLSQRLRSCATKSGMSVGDLMPDLLHQAKTIYEGSSAHPDEPHVDNVNMDAEPTARIVGATLASISTDGFFIL